MEIRLVPWMDNERGLDLVGLIHLAEVAAMLRRLLESKLL